ncbi:reverse transcriptase [Senna tora]|uniref:Reverse transcriptase n=1 Tax=Senna tora TaxID=362788 RepID=A0A834WDV9_9FABA|nr:reverse transcriptase [Senna tora]
MGVRNSGKSPSSARKILGQRSNKRRIEQALLPQAVQGLHDGHEKEEKDPERERDTRRRKALKFAMSTVSSGASASTASSSSKTYSLFNSSSQAASVKLDRSNYIVWEANVLPMIIGFLNRRAPPSSNECIVPFIIQSTDASSPHPAPRVINATDPTASSNSSPARTSMVKVRCDQSGIYLNQSKYAQDVLKRFNMEGCASVTTPMVTGRKFTANDGDKMTDPSDVSINSDCLVLVEDANNNKCSGDWKSAMIVKDIVARLSSLPNVSVHHVGRRFSMAADWLAKATLKRMCPLDWVCNPPSSLASFLDADLVFWKKGIG